MKRLLLLIAGCGLVHGAQAQDELGRLFFTPGERSALDARRASRVPDKPAPAPIILSPVTRLDGYVKRSSGPSTVWINGESLSHGAPRADGSVAVPVGDDGQRVPLRPGEAHDRTSGEVRDVIGDGDITIRRRTR